MYLIICSLIQNLARLLRMFFNIPLDRINPVQYYFIPLLELNSLEKDLKEETLLENYYIKIST